MKWPLDINQIRRGSLSNTFGMVRRNADRSPRPHQGWDLYAEIGTPCYAVLDGVITSVRNIGAYGLTVILQVVYEDHKYYLAYSHLSDVVVKIGEKVTEGQLLGYTGNTGNAISMKGKDQHLHFEVRLIPFPGKGLSYRVSPMLLFKDCPLKFQIDKEGRRI